MPLCGKRFPHAEIVRWLGHPRSCDVPAPRIDLYGAVAIAVRLLIERRRADGTRGLSGRERSACSRTSTAIPRTTAGQPDGAALACEAALAIGLMLAIGARHLFYRGSVAVAGVGQVRVPAPDRAEQQLHAPRTAR